MARIGLKNFRYSVLDSNDVVTTPSTLGKAIDCKVSLDLNTAELYADDTIAESDYSFRKGTVTLTIDDDDDTIFAEILGHTITSGEMVRKDSDVAPYVALGRILTKIVGGVYKYKVEFLSKVKFKDTITDEVTRGETLEYKTPTVEGSVLRKADGEWSRTQTFTTYAAASTYLDSLLTAPTTNSSSTPTA